VRTGTLASVVLAGVALPGVGGHSSRVHAITVAATLFRRRTLFVVLAPKRRFPAEVRAARLPVGVTIGGRRFETTLLPHSGRSYLLVVPGPIVRGMGARPGDKLTFAVALDLDRVSPAMPPELVGALQEIGLGPRAFDRLTIAYQREAVRYVDEGRTPESRQRRAESFSRRIAEYLERRGT
jgi:hypothetical protein